MKKWYEIYNEYKCRLIEYANDLGFDDLPYRRMALHDILDYYVREINYSCHILEECTPKGCNRATDLLASLVCELHTKNIS